MNNPGYIEKLKLRWGVKNAFQVLIILIVFAATGFSVLYLKQPIYNLAGISEQTPGWIKFVFYTITILPVYQLVLLFYGFIFGQFTFFWNFEKRMFSRMRKIFIK
ncbi:hypothetical protein BH23BAC1_BH23BAC1_06610 [soil metagenome]|jgi:hypothetical protein